MAPNSEPWTIERLLTWTTRYLSRKGSPSSRLDAEILLAHALACQRVALYTRYDDVVAEPALAAFRDLVRRRAGGAPVAYLVGRKEFFSLEFAVSPAVMIPRPETEFVVLEFLNRAGGREAPVVVDLGTGSGAIAVTVAHERRDARVWAVDASADALGVAAANAEKHGVAQAITFCHGDLFDALPAEIRGEVTFVLSNPPYIPTSEIETLPVGVKDHEPRVALDGGADGLEAVQRIVAGSPEWLLAGGELILEIGAPQEAAVRDLFATVGPWDVAPTVQDHSGHPRVVAATHRPSSLQGSAEPADECGGTTDG